MALRPERLTELLEEVAQERLSLRTGSPSDAEIAREKLADLAVYYIPELVDYVQRLSPPAAPEAAAAAGLTPEQLTEQRALREDVRRKLAGANYAPGLPGASTAAYLRVAVLLAEGDELQGAYEALAGRVAAPDPWAEGLEHQRQQLQQDYFAMKQRAQAAEERLAALEAEGAAGAAENERLRSVCRAAYDEILRVAEAHLDEEGYGPATLLAALSGRSRASYLAYRPTGPAAPAPEQPQGREAAPCTCGFLAQTMGYGCHKCKPECYELD